VGYGRGATGLVLYILSFLTTVGNAMVLHAIRTERRLQTVSEYTREYQMKLCMKGIVSRDEYFSKV
jgi:hypothetical protein